MYVTYDTLSEGLPSATTQLTHHVRITNANVPKML